MTPKLSLAAVRRWFNAPEAPRASAEHACCCSKDGAGGRAEGSGCCGGRTKAAAGEGERAGCCGGPEAERAGQR